MFRAFVLPVILMGIIGIPMLYSHHQRNTLRTGAALSPDSSVAPWKAANYQLPDPVFQQSPTTNVAQPVNYSPTGFPQSQPSQPANTQLATPIQMPSPVMQQSLPALPSLATNVAGQQVSAVAAMSGVGNDMAWAQPGMTPDFAKTETLMFPGDANGPDLSAQPMSFTPTIDLASLFRFDISKQFVTSRWDRVSTCPANHGLHGMRVALVTGTNSWDLHGSLTYWFDAGHRVQRITYRGWTGDASRLLQILGSQHQLKPQPTHWAGAYLSKRSGLLMKYPAVIDKTNAVQQLALVLELNNPRGNSTLSDDFRSLLPAAIESR